MWKQIKQISKKDQNITYQRFVYGSVPLHKSTLENKNALDVPLQFQHSLPKLDFLNLPSTKLLQA